MPDTGMSKQCVKWLLVTTNYIDAFEITSVSSGIRRTHNMQCILLAPYMTALLASLTTQFCLRCPALLFVVQQAMSTFQNGD